MRSISAINKKTIANNIQKDILSCPINMGYQPSRGKKALMQQFFHVAANESFPRNISYVRKIEFLNPLNKTQISDQGELHRMNYPAISAQTKPSNYQLLSAAMPGYLAIESNF